MASETGDVDFPISEFRVNFVGHDDHLAGDFLLRVFVARVIALNVAACALVAERGAEQPHGLADVGVCGKDFQVLWRRGRTTLLFAFAGLLRTEREKYC